MRNSERQTVLVIDDDPADRALSTAYLRACGDERLDIVEACSAAEGLLAVVDAEPDCILLDYRMPGHDGLEVIEQMHRTGLIDTHSVVMLTGQGDERVCATALKRGAVDYASKDELDPARMAEIVHQAFESAALRREVRRQDLALRARTRELEDAKRELEATLATLDRANRELEATHRRVEHELRHDAATGLANGALFEQQLRDAIRYAGRGGESLAVVSVGLADYVRIGEALGPISTDDLVSEAAARLRKALRRSDIVARTEPDTFTALLRPLSSPSDAGLIARKLQGELSRPYSVGGGRVPVTFRAGIALWPKDATDAASLRLRALTAMYEAEQEGGFPVRYYDAETNREAQSDLVLESHLREAVERDQLDVVYQPVVSLDGRRLLEVEALVRWDHPTRGPLGPSRFLPLAERSDLIVELGDWVMRTGLAHLRRWHDQGMDGLQMSFNLSPRELRSPGFAERLAAGAFDRGVSPHAIRCEVAERAIDGQRQWVAEPLAALHEIGVGVSLDDFGSGAASPALVAGLAIDRIKMHRGIVADAHESERNGAIAKALLEMARTLSLDTVAVGVEEDAGLTLFGALGCRGAQGFAVSRPLPPEELSRFVRRLT